MRMLTGAILLLTAEQAFAHAHLIGFPHELFAREILYPASLILGSCGGAALVWGLLTDRSSSIVVASAPEKSASTHE
jgi:hypothetical protein